MAAQLLQYAVPGDAPVVRRRRGWGWLALSLPSAVVPFVKFTCSTTPVGAVHEWVTENEHWRREDVLVTALAVGLIFGLFIVLWRVRLLWSRPLSTPERV